MIVPTMTPTQGMTANQPLLPMSCRRLTVMATFGQISAIDSRTPRNGIQPVTTLAPNRISQLIQKCWRRRRPLKDSRAVLKS